jgi:hypothetical protein
MEKQNMPGMASFGAMTDSLEMMQKMWSNMGIPGLVMPTLSVDEINKKISDLKAVEAWLSLNMNMLRGTIQSLEVQSGTLATLQSMSAAMGANASNLANAPKADQASASPPPFESPFSTPSQPADKSASEAAPAEAAKTGFEFPFWGMPAAAPAAPAAPATPAAAPAEAADNKKPAASASEAQPAAALPAANPAAWWNVLQDQFVQAVNSAVTEPLAAITAPLAHTEPARKSKPGARAKPTAKSATRKSSSSKSTATKTASAKGTTHRRKSA